MNRSILSLLLTVMVFTVLGGNRAVACPACNIHNYLAGSVQSSTNIFHGKVVRQVDDRTAEVEVLKVLRGKYKVGSTVKSEMYGSKGHIGKKFIFSNPTSRPPSFEVLQLQFEDEVLFLIQKKPKVSNVKEAIKRLQGVSVMTQSIGMEYLTNHYDKAITPLIAEINTLMPKVFSTHDVFFGEHRLGKLMEALVYRESNHAKEYALSWIDGLPKLKEEKIGWTSIPHNASSRGVFLRDMLRHSRKHKEFSNTLRKRLLTHLPNLSSRTLADAVYALVLSESAAANDIQTILKKNKSSDMLALGLYLAGNYRARWWAYDGAYAFWDKALVIAKQKELRAAISERIKRSEKFHKRKEKNANKAIDSGKK